MERNDYIQLTQVGLVTFMITLIICGYKFNKLLEKILEWYNSDMQTKWQRIRFDTLFA